MHAHLRQKVGCGVTPSDYKAIREALVQHVRDLQSAHNRCNAKNDRVGVEMFSLDIRNTRAALAALEKYKPKD